MPTPNSSPSTSSSDSDEKVSPANFSMKNWHFCTINLAKDSNLSSTKCYEFVHLKNHDECDKFNATWPRDTLLEKAMLFNPLRGTWLIYRSLPPRERPVTVLKKEKGTSTSYTIGYAKKDATYTRPDVTEAAAEVQQKTILVNLPIGGIIDGVLVGNYKVLNGLYDSGSRLGRLWYESWANGNQQRFFERWVQHIREGHPMTLLGKMKDHVKEDLKSTPLPTNTTDDGHKATPAKPQTSSDTAKAETNPSDPTPSKSSGSADDADP
ncbi:hypothetical protein IWQ62_001907 [Dispira parvispora]|uniref:Uncharacterized protein n=1 Tax=Dispira parvispora TaxID=1520584 RepID=A0A9W8ARE7_9FUNG|nr:hypothetical protein IWQ62_001907 [Dispira parvispora]